METVEKLLSSLQFLNILFNTLIFIIRVLDINIRNTTPPPQKKHWKKNRKKTWRK